MKDNIEKPPNAPVEIDFFANNNNNNKNNQNQEDLLNFSSLYNNVGNGSSNQTPTNNNNTTNAPDFLADLLGTTTSSSQQQPQASSSPRQQQQQPQSQDLPSLSIIAYQKDGITITFNFVKTDTPGMYRILATFTNSDSVAVNNFAFMVAVPKFVTLQIKPASGTQLSPFSQNNITQKLQLVNTLHNQKQMMIRIQISYDKNGQNIVERSQVSDFPN